MRREVVERDGWRCAYVSPAGRRCESKWLLEFDHIREFARGGESTADNVRLLCRAHNQFAAECTYGPGFMDEKRRDATEAREAQAMTKADEEVSTFDESGRLAKSLVDD